MAMPPWLNNQNGGAAGGPGTVANNKPVGSAGQPMNGKGKMDPRKAALARRIKKNQDTGKKN